MHLWNNDHAGHTYIPVNRAEIRKCSGRVKCNYVRSAMD